MRYAVPFCGHVRSSSPLPPTQQCHVDDAGVLPIGSSIAAGGLTSHQGRAAAGLWTQAWPGNTPGHPSSAALTHQDLERLYGVLGLQPHGTDPLSQMQAILLRHPAAGGIKPSGGDSAHEHPASLAPSALSSNGLSLPVMVPHATASQRDKAGGVTGLVGTAAHPTAQQPTSNNSAASPWEQMTSWLPAYPSNYGMQSRLTAAINADGSKNGLNYQDWGPQ